MIAFSAPTYDLVGRIVLPTRFTDEYQARRRGSVTATLDGGSAVYDTGYSITDQTWTATLKHPKLVQLTTLRYLISYYAELVLCCESGAYIARIEMALKSDTLAISARPLSRLDI